MPRTENHPQEPPWKDAESWREANRTIALLTARYDGAMQETRQIVRSLYRNMFSLFPLLDELCMVSCRYCPEPCCLSAYAWFDFKDLLFIHLNGLAIPPAQLMTDRKMICRYLGGRGCTLDRISRPWICTWYLCPTQMNVLRQDRAKAKKSFFIETAAEIRSKRKKLESAFIMETGFQ